MGANFLLLRKAISHCARTNKKFNDVDDPRLFHTLELLGMFASFRILLSKLKVMKIHDHSTLGLLAMVAAMCGIFSNWRKVVRKKCGAKPFKPTLMGRSDSKMA